MRDADGVLSTADLWIMAGINWVATAVAIFVIANALGQRGYKSLTPVPSPLANMGAEAERTMPSPRVLDR